MKIIITKTGAVENIDLKTAVRLINKGLAHIPKELEKKKIAKGNSKH